MTEHPIVWFERIGIDDVASVGGKNASLGEMVCELSGKGVRVPGEFATTAGAYRAFIADNGLEPAIRKAHAAGIKIGICGQAPSNYPDFAAFLVEEGIDSISLNPDSFVRTMGHISRAEQSAVKMTPVAMPGVI